MKLALMEGFKKCRVFSKIELLLISLIFVMITEKTFSFIRAFHCVFNIVCGFFFKGQKV